MDKVTHKILFVGWERVVKNDEPVFFTKKSALAYMKKITPKGLVSTLREYGSYFQGTIRGKNK